MKRTCLLMSNFIFFPLNHQKSFPPSTLILMSSLECLGLFSSKIIYFNLLFFICSVVFLFSPGVILSSLNLICLPFQNFNWTTIHFLFYWKCRRLLKDILCIAFSWSFAKLYSIKYKEQRIIHPYLYEL